MSELFDLTPEEIEELREARRAVDNLQTEIAHLVQRKAAADRELTMASSKGGRINDAAAAARFLGEEVPAPKAPADPAGLGVNELQAALRGLNVRHHEAEQRLEWAKGNFRRRYVETIEKAMDRSGERYARAAVDLLEQWKILEALNSILIDIGGGGLLPSNTWRSLVVPGSTRLPSMAKQTESRMVAFGGETITNAMDYRGTSLVVQKIADEAMREVGAWPFNRRIG